MAILIDGYNLLHVTGIFARVVGPGSLESLHQAFLQFLASHLDPSELPQTAVVFDAKGRRAAQRRHARFGEISVHYSARHEDADTLLAELIAQHTSPRRLTVVSSDHQVQRMARRRRAQAVDSEVWYADLLRRHQQHQNVAAAEETKPATPLSPQDTAQWMAEFTEPGNAIPDRTESCSTSEPIRAEPASSQDDDPDADPFPREYLESVERELLGEKEVPRPDRSGSRRSKKGGGGKTS